MTKVSCSVDSCSYYNNNVCYADCVKVGGQGSRTDKNTCCGTYLNKSAYSNLAAHTEYKNECQEVECNVGTCRHNCDQHCQLGSINVVGTADTSYYLYTDCANFEMK